MCPGYHWIPAVGRHVAVITHTENTALRNRLRADKIKLGAGKIVDIVFFKRLAVYIDNTVFEIHIDNLIFSGNHTLDKGFVGIVLIFFKDNDISRFRLIEQAGNQHLVGILECRDHGSSLYVNHPHKKQKKHNTNRKGNNQALNPFVGAFVVFCNQFFFAHNIHRDF